MSRQSHRVCRTSAGVVGLTLFSVAIATPAFARWSSSGVGQGHAKANSVGTVTGAAQTASTPSSVTIAWNKTAAHTAGLPVAYTVTRSGLGPAVCTAVSVTTCTESGFAPSGSPSTYTYTVTPTIGGWTGAAGTVVAGPSVAPAVQFVLSPSPATLTAGSSTSVTVMAKRADGSTDTTYSGALTWSGTAFVSSPDGSHSPTAGAATFVSGVATSTVTLYSAGTGLTLTASSGSITGSTSLTVNSSSPSRLQFVTSPSGSTASCPSGSLVVGNGGSLSVLVAVVDLYGNLRAQGASAATVTLVKQSGGGNAPAPSSLSINANSDPAVTNASSLLKLPVGSPADTTYTAASSTLSTVCVIKKQ